MDDDLDDWISEDEEEVDLEDKTEGECPMIRLFKEEKASTTLEEDVNHQTSRKEHWIQYALQEDKINMEP